MKSLAVLLLAATAAVQAAPSFPAEKRQIVGSITGLLGKGGKVADPPGAAPKNVSLTPVTTIPGAQKIKMRYGPYNVINAGKTSLTGEGGALWNYPDVDVPKPLDTEFTIFGFQAGLEYPNGTSANIDTGMWLHHMVHFTIGPGRQDATCFGDARSLPHLDVGTTPSGSERSFSSGNERTPLILGTNGNQKVGYQITPADKFAMIVDLMNMNLQDATVYVTVTYDLVPGFPDGWDNIKPVWFDANQCGTSEIDPPQQDGHFIIKSKPWKANFEGEIIGMGAHVHDGGAHVQISADGVETCDAVATYGGDPAYIAPDMNMDPMPKDAMKFAKNHISKMTACYNPVYSSVDSTNKVTNMTLGQTWTLDGHYNYTQYPGDLDGNGKQSSVMAISIMYVRVPREGVTLKTANVGDEGTVSATPAVGSGQTSGSSGSDPGLIASLAGLIPAVGPAFEGIIDGLTGKGKGQPSGSAPANQPTATAAGSGMGGMGGMDSPSASATPAAQATPASSGMGGMGGMGGGSNTTQKLVK